MTRVTITKLRGLLSVDWAQEFDNYPDDVDKQWEDLKRNIDVAMEQTVPGRVVTINSKPPTFHTLGKKSVQKQEESRDWRRFLQSQDAAVYQEYCQLETRCAGLLEKHKKFKTQ